MKLSKKILAIALAVIMVLSVLPFSAFATEYEAGSQINASELQTGDKISLGDTNVHALFGGAVLKAGQFLEFSSYKACEDWNKANGTVTSSDIYLSSNNFSTREYYFKYVKDDASGKCYVPIDENGNVLEYILVLEKTDDDFAPITFGTYVTYTVTWKNADGTVLETDTDVAEGTVPTYDKATPTKADDAQYTYSFAGWSPEVTAVTGDVTYTAVYSQSVRQYTVTWKNYDDSVIGTSTVNAGQTPEFSDSIGQIKAKPADENHSYEFTGWTPEIVAAEADAEYTATFVDVLSISNVDEWNSFAASVKDGNTYSGKIVRMTADVGPVTTMVSGTFSGTFDGGSHTLTVNISGGNASVATFEVVKDATIQNLTLAGSITSSGIHSAALVKSLPGSGTSCTIKNVDIYADVNCSNNYLGGFIGHAGTANTVNIENSIFAGSINKTGSGQGGYIGGFIGWSQQLTATIDNCAFTGSYSNIKSFNNIGFSYNAPTKITVNDFYSNVSEVFGTSANHGTRLYTPSSSYPTTVALVNHGGEKT
ncbi:MAG: hypothetical protein IKE65_01880, partial [Clostridia bacterium]|nr:hypothetical protein [Clostridia bacterium]